MLGEGSRHSFEYHERPRDTTAPVMLEVKNLAVDKLVHDLSFSVKAGEIIGFAGLMGSGRTEVLEALFGIRKIEGGEIAVRGRNTVIRRTKVQAANCPEWSG